jgi:hypothetical protein
LIAFPQGPADGNQTMKHRQQYPATSVCFILIMTIEMETQQLATSNQQLHQVTCNLQRNLRGLVKTPLKWKQFQKPRRFMYPASCILHPVSCILVKHQLNPRSNRKHTRYRIVDAADRVIMYFAGRNVFKFHVV